MGDVKRRSFLGGVIASVVGLVLPKPKQELKDTKPVANLMMHEAQHGTDLPHFDLMAMPLPIIHKDFTFEVNRFGDPRFLRNVPSTEEEL